MRDLFPLFQAVLFAVGVCWAGGGCAGGGAAGTADDRLRPVAEVNRIEVPDRIGTSDTLTIRLLGTVGPNGCYSLERVAVKRGAERVQITPLVNQDRRQDAMCTMAIVPLDETVRLAPPFGEGRLSVVVLQSEGGSVQNTVEVVR